MSSSRLVVGMTLLLVLGSAASAQNTVSDHSSNFGNLNLGAYASFEDTEGSDDYRAISAFRGDGQNLHAYEVWVTPQVIFTPNWSATDFVLSFWSSESLLLSDPGMQFPGDGKVLHTFAAPANEGWDSPAFFIENRPVFRFLFDLGALAIPTTQDNLHFMSVGMMGQEGQIGVPGILPSFGGSGTIGTDGARFWNAGGPVFPTTDVVPYAPYIADRITTIPAPAGIPLLVLGLPTLTRRSRR